MNTLVAASLALVQSLAEQPPEPEDVKAGWLGFAVFLLLALAVVVLAFSFVKHLRRAKVNFDARDAAEGTADGEPDDTDGADDSGPWRPGAEPNGHTSG
jgi:hypothetical protein